MGVVYENAETQGNSYIDISNLQYYNNDNTLMRRVGRET